MTEFGRLSELRERKELSAFLEQLAAQLQGVVRLLQPDGTTVYEASGMKSAAPSDCLALLGHEELIAKWHSIAAAGGATCSCGQPLAILPIYWQERIDGFLTVCPVPSGGQLFLASVTGMIEAYLTLARNAVQLWEKKSNLSAAHEKLYRETELLREEPVLCRTVLQVLQKYLRADVALFLPSKSPDTGWDSPFIQNDSEAPQEWIEDLVTWVSLAHDKKRCPLIISSETSTAPQDFIVLPENLEEQQQFVQLGGISFLSATVVHGKETMGRLAFCNRRIERGFSLDDLAWLQSVTSSISLSLHALRTRKFRERFLGSALHNLNTPMHSIQAIAERLSYGNELSATEREEWVRDLFGQTQRLAGLVRLAPEILRLEGSSLKLERFSLSDLIKGITHDLRLLAGQRQVSINTRLPAENIEITANEKTLYITMQSLLENALKFSPVGGVIEVELTHPSVDGYRISVTDQGPGIPEKQREMIFEEFVSIPRVGVAEGNGLGLAFARVAVEEHGGKLSCYAAPGQQGACFAFTLPTVQEL